MAVLYLLDTTRTREIYNSNMNKLDEFVQESVKKLIEQIPCMIN